MVWRGWALVTGLLLSGCFAGTDAGGDDSYVAESSGMDMPFPPAACMDDTSDADDCIELGDACSVTTDCPAGDVCAASFDGDIGTLRCEALCVLDVDDASWCSDDAACCNPESTCVRGLCMPGEGGSESSAGSSSDDGSTTAGSSDSSSTGSTT